jgi:hypothetical protein
MRRSLRYVCAIMGWAYALGMVWSVTAAQNPCAKKFEWRWKIEPRLEITAPSPIPDQCLGALSIGPALVTAIAGVKWEVDTNNCPEPPATRNETTVPITPQNTWELYSWPVGTTPLNGTGTTAQFTTIHAGYVVVQFKSQASVASPPWSAQASALTSPFGTGPEIKEPNLDPVTDNNFTFTYTPGSAHPNGECILDPDAVCGGSSEKWLDWIFPDISGCTKSVELNAWPYEHPTATYSPMPSANAYFGNKVVTVKRKPDNCTDSVVVQIFFSGQDDAVNHPGSGTGYWPNWHYYWRQTIAKWIPAEPFYNPSMVPAGFIGYTDYVGGAWRPYIGALANDYVNIPDGPDVGKQFTGIDCYAFVSRHEGRHVTIMNSWYPSGNHPDLTIDPDNDLLPDSSEEALGAITGNGGPFMPGNEDTDGDGQFDGHDYIFHTQSPWVQGAADASDWSNPGHQSNQ